VIFTPEEMRDIAENMLRMESEVIDGLTFYYLSHELTDCIDFSLPEWTGPMLEKILHDYWDKIRIRASKKRLVLVIYHRYGETREFDSAHTNRNIYDAWKWLRAQMEASDVQP